jgi:hypothetical protein
MRSKMRKMRKMRRRMSKMRTQCEDAWAKCEINAKTHEENAKTHIPREPKFMQPVWPFWAMIRASVMASSVNCLHRSYIDLTSTSPWPYVHLTFTSHRLFRDK